MSNRIILLSHGDFAEGLLNSAKMIIGELHNVDVVSLKTEMSSDDFEKSVVSILPVTEENILCFVDMFGGTPCNVATILSKEHNVHIVSGVNLPTFIQSYLNIDKPIKELIEIANQTHKESFVYVNELIEKGR